MPTSSPEMGLEVGCAGRRRALRLGAAALGMGTLGSARFVGRAGVAATTAVGVAAPVPAVPAASNGAVASTASTGRAAPAVPVKLPPVTLLDGSRYQPDTGRGNALIVVFWSVDCPFCRNHNPHVEKLYRAAAGRPLKVLTASIDADPARVASYVRDKAYTFPVTLDSAPLRSALMARKVIPLTCCIDRSGALREAIAGEMFEEDVLGLLKYAA